MRKIQTCLMGILLSSVAVAQSDEMFYGAGLTPRWGSNGEIDVYVSNHTKLPISMERLAVGVRLKSDQPCLFSYGRRLDLAPAETVKLTIADGEATRECLEAQSAAGRTPVPRALRFVRPSTKADTTQESEQIIAPRADAIMMEASLQVRGRAMRSQSRWIVKVLGQ